MTLAWQGLRGAQPDGLNAEHCVAVLNNIYKARHCAKTPMAYIYYPYHSIKIIIHKTLSQDGVRIHDVSCHAKKPTACEEKENIGDTKIEQTPQKPNELDKTKQDPAFSTTTRFISSSQEPFLSSTRSPKSLPTVPFENTFTPSFPSTPVVSSDLLFPHLSTSSNSAKPSTSQAHSLPHMNAEQKEAFTFSEPLPSTNRNTTDTIVEVRI